MLQFSRNALRLSPLGLLVLAACKSNDENITTPSNSNFAKADGTVTKGLLENALVFLDYNKDGIKDADEPSTRTDAKGSYTLVPTKEDFNIVVTTDDTTKDASSGAQAPGLTLSAPKGSKIVSPMTSLLKDGGLSAAEVSKALGLDEDIDILTFNPFAEGVDAQQALAVEKLATKVVAVVNSYAKVLQELGTDVSESKAFEQALAAVVEVVKEKSSNNSTLDLTKTGDLTEIKDKVIAELDTETAAANKTLIESVTTAIENVTVKIETVMALDDASKDVFKVSQQLANQVAAAVKDPNQTIAFTDETEIETAVANQAPTAMMLSADSITDGAGDLQIGTLSITDPDDKDPTPIWKIAKLADHGDFEISADGKLTLKSSPDLAAKASYSVTIVATDTGGATITKTFTITVKAAERAEVTLSNNKVAENDAGAEFGTLSGAASYKLAPVNDDENANNDVEIVEIDGVFTLKLKGGIATDYEQDKSGGTVDIIATDADGTETEHRVSIFSTDVDEAPEAIALDGSTLREGEAGQVIGTFSATDPEDDSLTFQLAPEADGNDNDSYEIVDGSTLKLKDGERLEADEEDFDDPDVVVVEVSDGTNTTTKSFDISLANNDTVERATTLTHGDEITGKISDASDVDIYKFTVQAGQAVRIAFTDGDNDATHKINIWRADDTEDPSDFTDENEMTTPYYLNVDPGEYYISVKSDADLDDYSLRVDTTTDSIDLSNKTVVENAAGAVIGTLSGAVSYELAASNNDNSNHLAEIVETDGVYTVKLKDGMAADYENNEYVDLDIIATDDKGAKTTYGLEVLVTDVDEAPEAPEVIALTDGVEITGKISDASDVDIYKFTVQAGQAVRIAFTDGDNDATHKINIWHADETEDPSDAFDGNAVTTPYYMDEDPGTWYLSVKSDADFDDYSLRVDTTTDSIELSNNTVVENAAGAVIGTLSGAVSYELAASNNDNSNDLAEIVETAGVYTVKLKDGMAADYETGDYTHIDIIATDDTGAKATYALEVLVTDVDEAPEAPEVIARTHGDEITGKISDNSDVDIFKIALGAGDDLDMTFTDGADDSATHAISLIDPNGDKTEIIAAVNDLTKTSILTDAAAGDYYIQIESDADFDDYTLMLDVA
jgi:VCBS repeat-containing protein